MIADLDGATVGMLVAAAVIVLAAAFVKGYWTGGASERAARRVERRRAASSAWARRTDPDVDELLLRQPDPRRIRLGELDGVTLANPPRRSLMVVAPTGAGKTPVVVVPSVLRHQGPAVVTSVKQDVAALTIAHRRACGPVWVFDPTHAGGHDTCRWTPLASIATYADAMRAAAWLADASKVDGRSLEDQQFWDTLGRKLLAPLLFLAAKTDRHMADVVSWVEYAMEAEVTNELDRLRTKVLTEGGAAGDALADAIDAIEDSALRDRVRDVDLARSAWNATLSRPEKTRGSVFATAEVVLEAWAHPQIRDAVSTKTTDGAAVFSIDRLLDEGGTLYLVAPESDQQLFAPIFETILNAVLRDVERRSAATALPLDPPLLMMIDEAAQVAPLRRMDKVASKGANEGVILVSIWQDKAQIDTIYGREKSRTVRANHTSCMYLPGITEEETLESLSRSISEHTVQQESTSTNRDGHVSVSVSTSDERLAPPQWLRTRPRGTAICLTSRCKPIQLQVRGWYEDPEIRALIPADVAARFDAMFGLTPAPSPRKTSAGVA